MKVYTFENHLKLEINKKTVKKDFLVNNAKRYNKNFETEYKNSKN